MQYVVINKNEYYSQKNILIKPLEEEKNIVFRIKYFIGYKLIFFVPFLKKIHMLRVMTKCFEKI